MNVRSSVLLVSLLLTAPAFAQAKPAPASPAKTSPAAPAKSAAHALPATPLDLNTATVDQLKALPGIGDVYAKRIMDGRPYSMKNQLVQKGIVPQAAYDQIKDGIVARRATVAKPAPAPAAHPAPPAKK